MPSDNGGDERELKEPMNSMDDTCMDDRRGMPSLRVSYIILFYFIIHLFSPPVAV